VAVPVTAAWTGLVAFRVLREARIRVLGPSAIDELCDTILQATAPLGDLARDTCVRAVGSAIVRSRDMHPNLRLLLARVSATLAVEGPELGDVDRFLHQLERLSPREQRAALCFLNVAAVIDGRVKLAELALVKEALERTGHPSCSLHVRALRRAFVRGDAIDPRVVLKVYADDDQREEAGSREESAAPGGAAARSR
jgi:hypothetical protein